MLPCWKWWHEMHAHEHLDWQAFRIRYRSMCSTTSGKRCLRFLIALTILCSPGIAKCYAKDDPVAPAEYWRWSLMLQIVGCSAAVNKAVWYFLQLMVSAVHPLVENASSFLLEDEELIDRAEHTKCKFGCWVILGGVPKINKSVWYKRSTRADYWCGSSWRKKGDFDLEGGF